MLGCRLLWNDPHRLKEVSSLLDATYDEQRSSSESYTSVYTKAKAYDGQDTDDKAVYAIAINLLNNRSQGPKSKDLKPS